MNTIFGIKQDMTQVFDALGKRRVATKILAGPCRIVQIKTSDKDGYTAVQLGLGIRKRVLKPVAGHLKKANITDPVKYLREVRLSEEITLNPGDTVNAGEVFEAGDIVKVVGVTKGKGFAGVVKRWGFHGGPKTHGQSDRHRAPGSIGSGTTPGRVVKGKKMAGRMGGDTTTVEGLTVLEVNPETNTILVSGPVPGANQGMVTITKTGKKKQFPGMWVKKTAAEEAAVVTVEETPAVEEESLTVDIEETTPTEEETKKVEETIPEAEQKEEETAKEE